MHATIDLIEAEIPRLRRYARSLVLDADQADDLVQACLERAIRAKDSWQPGTGLRAWLFTILRNCHISAARRARHDVVALDEHVQAQALAVSGGQEAHVALLQVKNAYQRLSQDHREVLMLCAIEGLAYEEAAAMLEVPVGTVRSRLARARSALREQLEGSNVISYATRFRLREPGDV